ncbi:MAG TPA: hypothetical protein VIL88_04355 [Devosia sp.]|jgi:hypothetical protein|uniref:hypothetical protein n=1 Tax=Devosia sp. TaxID=1871048 RepID=UPI002F93A3D4
MKKTVFVAALLATSTLGTASAFAFTFGGGHHGGGGYPGGGSNNCGTGMCTQDSDFYQKLLGFQKALNMIVDVEDATAIVQEAVNAGNLISVGDAEDIEIDLANVEQYGDLYQFALNKLEGDDWSSDFTDVTQSATNVVNSISGDGVLSIEQTAKGAQDATNKILGSGNSTFIDLEQAATNVVNTVTASTSKTIEQVAHTDQTAINVIVGGEGGYDNVGSDINWDEADAVSTQAAVNAANLVNIDTLTGAITQSASYNPQIAVNAAIFHGYDADVFDFGQSATNVVNSVTVGDINPSINCNCYDGWEINQEAFASQLSSNLLETMGSVTNSVQSATNVANSISIPSGD